MLKTRVITAVLALIPMILIFVKGNAIVLSSFFGILVGLSAFEIAAMLFPAIQKKFGDNPDALKSPAWMIVLVVLAGMALYAAMEFHDVPVIGYFGIGFLLLILIGVFAADSVDLSFGYAAGFVISLAYAVFPFIAIESLHQKSNDPRYVFLLCAIVWFGDTGAYFAGRTLGKHKLAPRMSPNKTWEGSIGGIIASLIGGLLMKAYYGEGLVGWLPIVLCSIFGGIFGQLGDLTESTFKRFSGVKDSGKILPGHGGFLDRVDGLLFAAPAIWLILVQFGS